MAHIGLDNYRHVFFGSENIDGVIYLEIEVATMEDFRVGCKRVGI